MKHSDSKTPDYGIVYLLVNECMPGLVKIGKTSRHDLKKRMKELYTTGVPLPFECVYACKVKLSCMDELEKALHAAFAPSRVNEGREFFRMSESQAIPLLKLLTSLNEGEVTDVVAAEIENDLDVADKAAIAKSKSKRPPLDFFVMGLSVGDVLSFVSDPSVTVTVASAKKVYFHDELRSLTSVTTKLLGSKWNVQPTPYWEFKGENLRDLYDKANPITEE